MKKPLVDFFKNTVSKYMQEQDFLSKFIRYWGTTTYNGVEYLMPYNNYFSDEGYPWTQYTSIFPDACSNINPSGLSGRAPDCSRQKKLLEFLRVWDQLSQQNTDGLESAWLYLNPTKGNIQKNIIINELNTYIQNNIDIQGRLTFKIRVLANGSWIPGAGLTNETINDHAIDIPDYNVNYTASETVYLLDADGHLVYKNGVPVTTEESVRTYLNTQNYLRSNVTDIWKYNTVLSDQGDSTSSIESLLARYCLFYMPTSNVRISYVQKGLIPYTVNRTYGSDGVMNDTFVKIQEGGVYHAFNNDTKGVIFALHYTIPTYDITFVVRHPSTIVSTDALCTQLFIDAFYDYITTTSYNGDSAYQTDVVYHIEGRVNGYITSTTINNEQSKSSPWGLSYGVKTFSDPLNMWEFLPLDGGYWVLRKDVLTTSTYIPQKKDRIAYINSILDSNYHSKSAGWLSVIIIIVAIVIAVLSYGTLSEVSTALVAAATSITVFSLVLSLGGMLAQSMGSYADAVWISQFNKSISPLVMVASIFLAFNSFLNVARTALNTIGSAASITVRQLLDRIIEWVKTKIVNISIQDGMKILSKAFEMYEKNSIKKLQSDITAKQEELQKYQEANEQNKYGDINKNFAQILLNPLQMLGFSYEFDRPYEPVYGQIHSGNSCRTTVLGLYGQGAEMYVSNIR